MNDPTGRIVGVDYGARRTGVALADPLRMFARPHGTFTPEEALQELLRLDQQEGIAVLVVGWPLTPEGEKGAAVEQVERYVERLQKMLPHVRLERWDERYTSVEARELLVQAGVSKKRRSEKGRVDAAAAAVILQSYLDENSA